MNCTWSFSITFNEERSEEATSIGISTRSLEDVLEFSKLIELPCKVQTYKGNTTAVMDVCRDAGDKRLKELLRLIEVKYGFKPCSRRVVPRSDMASVFGVRRFRTYTNAEINECELLAIDHVEMEIGKHKRGTMEQADSDTYVSDERKPKPNVFLGMLTPFRQISVSKELKTILEAIPMRVVKFEPVINLEGVVWKLTSEVTMPRSLIPIQNEQGEDVLPDVWRDQWDAKYFDDSGCLPVELRYKRSDIEKLPPFDIAVTLEREGLRFSASRYLVVTQQFRLALDQQKIKKIRYTPVRLV
jgi:hypothetical protein